MVFLWAGAIIVFSVFVVFLRKRAKAHLRETQIVGIIWLAHLRTFVSRAQRHRGLSTAYINGNSDRSRELENLSRSISGDIKRISDVGIWITENDNWNAIVEHWQRLADSYKTNSSSENNLIQHNRLIQNTLYLIEEMSDEHALLEIKYDQSESIEFLWKDLLHAIEYLGQARAVGSGITAKHSCSSVERIKMNYLHKKIEENCLGVTQYLPQGHIAEQEVRTFLSTIQRDLLAHRCMLDTTQYFDMATKTIEFLYEQYDKTLVGIKESNALLEARA